MKHPDETRRDQTVVQEDGPFLSVRTYRVFDTAVVVLSESPEMSEHVHCFLKCLEIPESESVGDTVRIALFEAPGRQIMVSCPELGLTGVHALGLPAWVGFRRIFIQLIANAVPEYYTMHASAVADDAGNAAVIAGPSNAGKTSLLIALLERGFRLMCDDYAPIGLTDGALVSLPVGVTVTRTNFAQFPKLDPLRSEVCGFRCQGRWQWTVNLGDLYPVVPANERIPSVRYFGVSANFGGESRVTQCDRDEAVWLFQESRLDTPQCMPSLSACGAEYRERALALAREAADDGRSFSVLNGNVAETAERVAACLAE
ncbi:MAG: hypothetical protein GY851_06160 [bacterium]|nr:hypothetical protein [bacterium]